MPPVYTHQQNLEIGQRVSNGLARVLVDGLSEFLAALKRKLGENNRFADCVYIDLA